MPEVFEVDDPFAGHDTHGLEVVEFPLDARGVFPEEGRYLTDIELLVGAVEKQREDVRSYGR